MILLGSSQPSSKRLPKTRNQVNGSVKFSQLPKLGTESQGNTIFMRIDFQENLLNSFYDFARLCAAEQQSSSQNPESGKWFMRFSPTSQVGN